MPRSALIAMTLAFSTGLAVAQSGSATDAYKAAMQKMDAAMQTMKPTGDTDMDFVMMMTPHHQAAVDMAEAYLSRGGSDPELKPLAEAIIESQKKEIAEMNAWMHKHGM